MISFHNDKWGTRWKTLHFGEVYLSFAWTLYGRGSHIYNPSLYTNWQWLIKKAWGTRRVSSRAAPGTKAYPSAVQAALSMWIAWINAARTARKLDIEFVVVSRDGTDHGANYAAELAAFAVEASRKADRDAWTPERIAQTNAIRADARAVKDYALSDSLRKEMEAAGIVVSDNIQVELK